MRDLVLPLVKTDYKAMTTKTVQSGTKRCLIGHEDKLKWWTLAQSTVLNKSASLLPNYGLFLTLRPWGK